MLDLYAESICPRQRLHRYMQAAGSIFAEHQVLPIG